MALSNGRLKATPLSVSKTTQAVETGAEHRHTMRLHRYTSSSNIEEESLCILRRQTDKEPLPLILRRRSEPNRGHNQADIEKKNGAPILFS